MSERMYAPSKNGTWHRVGVTYIGIGTLGKCTSYNLDRPLLLDMNRQSDFFSISGEKICKRCYPTIKK